MAKKFKSKTVSSYRRWNVGKWGLYGGMYVAPVAPAGIMTAIHWNEWFSQSGISLPAGLVTLLLGVIMAIMGITKKDELFQKNVSGLFYFTLVFAVLGLSFKFLANICNQMGDMFLLTACGVLTSATCDQVNKSLVIPRVNEYRGLIDKNYLDRKAKKKQERELRAEQEAKEESQRIPTE